LSFKFSLQCYVWKREEKFTIKTFAIFYLSCFANNPRLCSHTLSLSLSIRLTDWTSKWKDWKLEGGISWDTSCWGYNNRPVSLWEREREKEREREREGSRDPDRSGRKINPVEDDLSPGCDSLQENKSVTENKFAIRKKSNFALTYIRATYVNNLTHVMILNIIVSKQTRFNTSMSRYSYLGGIL
jgi:hypothetical protein